MQAARALWLKKKERHERCKHKLEFKVLEDLPKRAHFPRRKVFAQLSHLHLGLVLGGTIAIWGREHEFKRRRLLHRRRGDIDKGYDILKNNSFGYFQYFKAQALIGMGKPLVAKQVLDSVRQLPAGSIFTSLVSKKAKLLHENL